MHDPEKSDAVPATAAELPPDAPSVTPSAFDPLTGIHRAQWVLAPPRAARTSSGASRTAEPDLDNVETRPFTEDGTCVKRRTTVKPDDTVSHASLAASSDGLTLARLYVRFDAIARGWAKGNSSAAHVSILERLAANQAHGVELGWSNFLLSRRGGTGRLELHGSSMPGWGRELVPDQIPWR